MNSKYLLYLWALPNALIGFLLAPFYGARSWRWVKEEGCMPVLTAVTKRMIGDPAAQTHGWIIFYAKSMYRDKSPRLFRHEYRHVVQGFVGGFLYALAYVLNWLFLFVFTPKTPEGEPRWYRAYWHIWFEKDARSKE